MQISRQQHEFCCGIGIHANSMHVCVVDLHGKRLLHKNFSTKTAERTLIANTISRWSA